MTDSNVQLAAELPAWLRGVAIIGVLSLLGAGAFGLFLLSAFMPYGHPKPSASAVYLRFCFEFIAAPMLLAGAAIAVGRQLYRNGFQRLGALLHLLPLIGPPLLLMKMLS